MGFSPLLIAQSNFYKLSGGVGLGGTFSFTDVYKSGIGYAALANIDYNFSPFVTAGLEIQKGMVRGGNVNTDPHMREFTNSYMAFAGNFKFRAGEITDFYYNDFLNLTKGFYLGTGLGYIKNNMTSIVRVKPDGSGYVFPGDDKGSSIYLPINIGMDFFIPDRWGDIRYTFNVNFQSNFVFADNLDGYNDPKTTMRNQFPDMYNVLSVGLKIHFGPSGIANKSIR